MDTNIRDVVLKKMITLRPYSMATRHRPLQDLTMNWSVLEDLENQVQAQIKTLTLKGLIDFAQGAEAYMLNKYGRKQTEYITHCKWYWIGLDGFHGGMAVCMDLLDEDTKQQLVADKPFSEFIQGLEPSMEHMKKGENEMNLDEFIKSLEGRHIMEIRPREKQEWCSIM